MVPKANIFLWLKVILYKGDYIMDGNPAPHDILAIMIEALANYMNEVRMFTVCKE